jgi:hypothetical protein
MICTTFVCLFLMASAALQVAAEPPARGAIVATISGSAQPIDVTLLLRQGDEWKEVDRRPLTPSAREVRFEKLPAGVFQVLVRGAGSTEQFATKMVIGDGDTRHALIAVDPMIVKGHLTIGGHATGPGSISLRHKEFRWQGTASVATDGTFQFPLWQRGPYISGVRAAAIATPYIATIDLEGTSPIQLSIEIPDAAINGVVRDAKSGAPVSNASVALQSNSASGEHHVSVLSDKEGRFNFNGLPFGRHTVRVVSPKYLEPLPIVIELDSTRSRRDLDVPLETGIRTTVVVLDAGNRPVANAALFAVVDARRRSRGSTDEKGSALLPLPESGGVTLVAIANERGFAVVRLERTTAGRVTLHLLPAASSLRIRALTTDGKPMPRFSVLMRYEGELMPLEVAEELTVSQGLQFITNEASEMSLRNIPSGRYEFSPFRTTEEAESILAAGNGVTPPIQVDVHPGENSIVVKFAAR